MPLSAKWERESRGLRTRHCSYLRSSCEMPLATSCPAIPGDLGQGQKDEGQLFSLLPFWPQRTLHLGMGRRGLEREQGQSGLQARNSSFLTTQPLAPSRPGSASQPLPRPAYEPLPAPSQPQALSCNWECLPLHLSTPCLPQDTFPPRSSQGRVRNTRSQPLPTGLGDSPC